jgi:hypothetical protein
MTEKENDLDINIEAGAITPDSIKNMEVSKNQSPPVQATGASSSNDEIDFNALRIPPSGILNVRKDITLIPIRKPKKTEFFRKRPGADWEIDLPLYEDVDQETYLVTDAECLGFLNDQGLIKRARIHTLMTYGLDGSGVLFLSPIGLPNEDSGMHYPYNQSREEAYTRAETQWVRINANKSLGGYDLHTPESHLNEPTWPTKPSTLNDALLIAFKNRYIRGPDHPIIKRLKGQL